MNFFIKLTVLLILTASTLCSFAASAKSWPASIISNNTTWVLALKNSIQESDLGANTQSNQQTAIVMATSEAYKDAGKIISQSIYLSYPRLDGNSGHRNSISLANSYYADLIVGTIIQGHIQIPTLASAFTPQQLKEVADFITMDLTE